MSEPTIVTDREVFLETVGSASPGARIPVEVRTTVGDPFAAYRRARDGPGGAYLETTGGQPGWGYFAVDPIERLTVGSEAVPWWPSKGDGPTRPSEPAGPRSKPAGSSDVPSADGSPTLSSLQARLDAETLVRGDCDVPYPCGAIGWLSYDVARELEDLPDDAEDDRGLPRLQFALFDRIAAWREPREAPVTLRITVCPRTSPRTDAGALYDGAIDRAFSLIERIHEGDPAAGPPLVRAREATFESDCGRAAFADRVRRVKGYVRDGDTFQANVSHRLRAPAAVHPVEAFDALREANPAPYSALLEYPAADLVSASPELLLEREGDRVRTEPIAGTRPRGATDAEDRSLERELRVDEKERAEHAMLVDLERNDLGKVCEYGSVEVAEYRRVDRYSEVMHLVSLVEGRLREDADLAEAIAAVFPGGTITGAPKPRTMEIVEEVEATRRGPYTGSIGIVGFDGRATLNIVIRTLVRHADRYDLRVGAGIVHDSEPDREYAETLDKARALVKAVDEALGERAAVTVEGGADRG